MRIVDASPELTKAAHSLIVCRMVCHLVTSCPDIRCDTSVTVTLARAGFGADSIRALRFRAVEIAGHIAAASTKVH